MANLVTRAGAKKRRITGVNLALAAPQQSATLEQAPGCD